MSSSSASTVRPTGAGPSRSRPGPARGRSTSSKSSASSRSSRAARPWRGVRAGTSLCRADPKQALAHEPPDQHETAVHVERAGKIGRGERLVHVEDAPDGFGGMGGKHDLLAVEGEHEGAVRLGQGHDRRPALELGLRVDILERAQLRELAVADRAPGPRELLASAPLDGVARELPMEKTNEVVRLAPLDRLPEAELVAALVERRTEGIEPGDDVDADREVERVAFRGQRLVQPAAREVERVTGLEDEIVHRYARRSQLLRVLLVLERQLERRLVHEPPLLARNLQHEDVVRVVVHRKPLRGPRGVVRVDLGRVPERLFQRAAERRQLGPAEMEPLEHDRRAAFPFAEHAVDVHRAREAGGPPRDVHRVVARRQLLPGLDEPEPGVAQTARGDDALHLLLGEKVVVAPRLVALHDEGPTLPVVGEELGLACRLDAAPEGVERLRHNETCAAGTRCAARAGVFSRAHMTAYGRSLRPWLAPPSAPRRRIASCRSLYESMSSESLSVSSVSLSTSSMSASAVSPLISCATPVRISSSDRVVLFSSMVSSQRSAAEGPSVIARR